VDLIEFHATHELDMEVTDLNTSISIQPTAFMAANDRILVGLANMVDKSFESLLSVLCNQSAADLREEFLVANPGTDVPTAAELARLKLGSLSANKSSPPGRGMRTTIPRWARPPSRNR